MEKVLVILCSHAYLREKSDIRKNGSISYLHANKKRYTSIGMILEEKMGGMSVECW